MQATLLPLFLILLNYSGWASGQCTLENGTMVRCNELEDVKYINTYEIDSLKASVSKSILHPGYFTNLTSLRNLDLSGGRIERIEPGSFNKLENLTRLNLAENRIRHLELGSVDSLNRLHSLVLRRNNFEQLPPALARLRVLRHLDIQGNPLQCNCATLKVRDLITKRGVQISKKALCAGPNNMKGTPLFKPDAGIICHLEEYDNEMQNDQMYKDPEEENGSGDLFEQESDSKEFVKASSDSVDVPKEPEIETPFPQISTTAVPKTTEPSPKSTSTVEEILALTQVTDSTNKQTDKDEEIFVDSEENKEQTSTMMMIVQKEKVYKDALFDPVEGSGEVEDGSGEGSGTRIIFGGWKKIDEEMKAINKEESSSNGWLDLFNIFGSTTETSTVKEDPDLEEEEFIDVSSTKEVDEETFVSEKSYFDETVSSTTDVSSKTSTSATNEVEIIDNEVNDMTKMGKSKVSEEGVNNELAEPAKQSKKGMGSYVVLAALLAILATLIGIAAYKGDFCRKRRKRDDVEIGTELKDMQKALLETGNSTQPKIASNGNVENAPLVEDATDHEEIKCSDDRQVTADVQKSSNGISDHSEPVKPPHATTPQDDPRNRETAEQKDETSLKDDLLSTRTNSIDPVTNNSTISRLPGVNVPPLSPGAQRVKITLQENPDSIPRTPILVTRTMAGENLVKMQ
ncbi:Leucine-rich repeat-containing protein 26 [Anthophora retusa]